MCHSVVYLVIYLLSRQYAFESTNSILFNIFYRKWINESHSVVSDSAIPWTILSMEFSRPEYWSGEPFPSPGDLPNPGNELRSLALQADSLPAELQGKSTIQGNLFLLLPDILNCLMGYSAAAAKSLQSCPTLCDPMDVSPPGFPVPGNLQARTLEWVAISFSNAWKWKVKVKSVSHVRL